MPGNQRAGAAPTSIPSRQGRPDEMDEAMARSFDSFSRSVPSTTPFLEAEPAPIALPYDAEADDGDGIATGATVSDRESQISPTNTMHKRPVPKMRAEDAEASETSPLLGGSDSADDAAGTSAAAAAQQDGESPFLNGVSVGRFWAIFSLVLASLFFGSFDSTIMASSHPVITSYFNSANSASWLSTTFLLTSTAFQPLLGRLSDSIGRKPLFIMCVGILTVATAWCGLAQSLTSFVAARAFCGLGAGGSTALGSIMTSDLVPIS